MARVTVEDCVTRIPNRFDLVMVAAHRARDIAAGVSLTVERDNDKNPVVALREIADRTIDIAAVREEMVKSYQKHVTVEEPEEELVDLSVGEEELAGLAGAASLGAEAGGEARSGEEDAEAEGLDEEDLEEMSLEEEAPEEEAPEEEEEEEEEEEDAEEADVPPDAEDPEEAPDPEEI